MAEKFKVALNCGHGRSVDGSWDSGCAYAGYTEAALMLPITKSAVKYLRSYGVTVISDSDKNNNRNMISDVRWANDEECDLYISVHCDYSKAPSGVMPLFVSAKGKKLAKALNNAVKSGMKMKSRGVIRRTDLWELNGTDMVACILETGSIRADLKLLRNKTDAYGKCIAKGICDYLGVKAEDKKVAPKPAPTPKKKVVPAKKLYRVRASWNEPATQVGAFSDLENAKQSADVNHLNVYASNGKLVYSGKKKETIADKMMKACKTQIATMKKTKYGWRKNPTVENTKEEATCASFVSVVFQRVGALKSGECIWHDGKGYGTGKVYIWGKNGKRPISAEDPMELAYMGNKTISSLKSKLKVGDAVMLDDNKSGEKGSGGHEFILAGWDGDDPLVWDMEPNRVCLKTQKPRVYNGNRKVLAIVRLK